MLYQPLLAPLAPADPLPADYEVVPIHLAQVLLERSDKAIGLPAANALPHEPSLMLKLEHSGRLLEKGHDRLLVTPVLQDPPKKLLDPVKPLPLLAERLSAGVCPAPKLIDLGPAAVDGPDAVVGVVLDREGVEELAQRVHLQGLVPAQLDLPVVELVGLCFRVVAHL